MTRRCPICSTILSRYNTDAYCFPCQDNGKVPTGEKVQLCKICGGTIHGRQTWARYCSEDCRAEGQRRINKESRRRMAAKV